MARTQDLNTWINGVENNRDHESDDYDSELDRSPEAPGVARILIDDTTANDYVEADVFQYDLAKREPLLEEEHKEV